MTARLLYGKEVAEKIKSKTHDQATSLIKQGIQPGLAVVIVGNNVASKTYVNSKVKACQELGIYSEQIELADTINTSELIQIIHSLNIRTDIHGILVQLPLPTQIDAQTILNSVNPSKDVDGFHPINLGKLALKQDGFIPCTPAGIIELLDHYQIPIQGKKVVVLGRSHIVGLPMALLLLHRNATVTICHSHTKNIDQISKNADILIAAIGRKLFVTKNFMNPDITIVDVGINQLINMQEITEVFGKESTRHDEFLKKNYTLVGDVHPVDATEHAANFTPVPGGVGPLTIAMLMHNTVKSATIALQNKQS